MSGRVPPLVRWLIALTAPLVPSTRREQWRRQWHAELEHRCGLDHGGGGLLRFTWGSVAHALYLRSEEMRMGGLFADLRHSARALTRRPGYTLLAVVTLAIGIGAATAIFSLAEALVLRPLPLPDSDRLVRLYSTNPTKGHGWFSVSYPDYQDLTERSGAFASSTLYQEYDRDVSDRGDPERIRLATVHEDFFQTLGSTFVMGRPFGEEDHVPSGETTAVLAERFWAARFGSDPDILGKTIRIDGRPHTVIGVVAQGHSWPHRAVVWTPVQWAGTIPFSATLRSNHNLQVVGRLVPDAQVQDVSQQVQSIAQAIYAGPDIDDRDIGTEAVVVPLRTSDGIGQDAAAIFGTLGTAVFFVLLIACMNASGLLLTRNWARAREFSLRAALGAGRTRLVVTLLTESVLLAALGGILGAWLAVRGLERAWAMTPPEIRVAGDVELNALVILAAIGVSLLAAVLAGLLPALRASKISLADAIRDGSGQAGYGRSATRLRHGMVVAQLALSLALLVGAGLAVRGLQRQLSADPGFDSANLLSFAVRIPGSRYSEDALVDEYYRQAIERLERHPGIRSATTTSKLPLGGTGNSLFRAFVAEGQPRPPRGPEFGAYWIEVDPEYFETIGVHPSPGRAFTDDDDRSAPLVAIVNQTMASRMSPDETLVGKQIRSIYDEDEPRTVVGIVNDIQLNGVSRARRQPVVFVPRKQWVRLEMTFLLRTAGDPSELIPEVRQMMANLDPDVALVDLQSLENAHAADLAGIRFMTTLFGSFGGFALLLAISGVYGLVSYSVSRRTQEIGVRMAMGATSLSVRGAVLRESMVLSLIGLAVGSGLAYVAARVLSSAMDGIALMEASTFVGVAALLVGAVFAATWVPATRATRVDPVEALRSE
jgi:putative ABC transport system permease protein